MANSRSRKNKGFTLIEMIIALGIFSVVVTAAANLFVAGLKGQRKSLTLQYLQNDVRYTSELLSREIRMSRIEADSTEDVLHITAFKASGAEDVVYSLSNEKILRNGESLISNQVNISRFKFYIYKKTPTLVTVIINAEGIGTSLEQQTVINFQTTISTRDYIGG